VPEVETMTEFANPQLSAWESFYVILGTSAAALIGLQFVVMTLVTGRRNISQSADTVNAFGTPTVVHLASALVVSAIAAAPWGSLSSTSTVLTGCGVAGLVYCGVVLRRELTQTGYKPVWQDWLWYAALPSIGYAALALSAAFLRKDVHVALFIVATSALGLLLIGIHNAWDSVTHIVTSSSEATEE